MTTPVQRVTIRHLNGPISTDDIIPGRYKHMYTDPKDLAPHVFENYDAAFGSSLRPGDAIYCREIFGIGSSREQAVTSLLAAGVIAVLAPRFGRIFFRNAWNLGLLALPCGDLPFGEGEAVTLDLAGGTVEGTRERLQLHSIPAAMLEMWQEGGLLARVQKRIAAGTAGRRVQQ